ncbi:MAG TPA: molybdopterin cofactor-binding domain-containing protein, partial [Novosphingobium sp.]|nr:molybdopterin cofactor-binding domain-containing protein [Novosphingobium sp.]
MSEVVNEPVRASNLSRRAMLRGMSVAAGALVVGAATSGRALAQMAKGAPAAPHTGFGAMVAIAPDGVVSFTCPSSEMGQGTQETLARILAEELDCDWERLTILQPWADRAFNNPVMGKQMTASSATTTGYYMSLRKAGAAARLMLIQAAAAQWAVAESDLIAQSGFVIHAASQRRAGYGTFAAAASALVAPADPPLKP